MRTLLTTFSLPANISEVEALRYRGSFRLGTAKTTFASKKALFFDAAVLMTARSKLPRRSGQHRQADPTQQNSRISEITSVAAVITFVPEKRESALLGRFPGQSA
jgi:hypothetical protein